MAQQISSEPGWYPFGKPGVAGRWDGMSWTGEHTADASVPQPPRWNRRPWRFLTHRWFWLVVVGLAFVILCGIIGNNGQSRWWVWPAGIGVAVVMLGVISLFQPHLRFTELDRLGLTIGAGVVSGAVAIAAATALEGVLEPRLNMPFAVDLWLSGPIEETCKIAIPLILLIWARPIFGDPRRGVLLVLISGAVFGVGESVEYMGGGHGTNSHLLQAVTRPLTEIGHPLWATIAASAIWLGAHRSGRLITRIGVVGWLVAAGLHSLHDGIGSFGQHGSQNTVTDQDVSMAEVVREGIALNVFSIGVAVISFLILRHFLRELVPPTAVAANSPHWRPQLKWWGVPIATRKQWAARSLTSPDDDRQDAR